MRRHWLFFSLLLLPLSGLRAERSTIFRAQDPLGRNTVQFRTSAPLEDIVGTTNQVTGRVELSLEDIRQAQGSFEVDLGSLQTGISLRDRHMRENFLHTARYPKARFTLKRVLSASSFRLEPNRTIEVVVEGDFQLHGVQKRIQVPLKVTYLPRSQATMGKLPGDLLRVSGSFPVKLADYGIERPQMVLLKVGETAQVSLDVFASNAGAEEFSQWMERMKAMMNDQ